MLTDKNGNPIIIPEGGDKALVYSITNPISGQPQEQFRLTPVQGSWEIRVGDSRGKVARSDLVQLIGAIITLILQDQRDMMEDEFAAFLEARKQRAISPVDQIDAIRDSPVPEA